MFDCAVIFLIYGEVYFTGFSTLGYSWLATRLCGWKLNPRTQPRWRVFPWVMSHEKLLHVCWRYENRFNQQWLPRKQQRVKCRSWQQPRLQVGKELTQDAWDPRKENIKFTRRQTSRRMWKKARHIPYSWMRQLGIVKCFTPPQYIYPSNAVPIKTLVWLF